VGKCLLPDRLECRGRSPPRAGPREVPSGPVPQVSAVNTCHRPGTLSSYSPETRTRDPNPKPAASIVLDARTGSLGVRPRLTVCSDCRGAALSVRVRGGAPLSDNRWRSGWCRRGRNPGERGHPAPRAPWSEPLSSCIWGQAREPGAVWFTCPRCAGKTGRQQRHAPDDHRPRRRLEPRTRASPVSGCASTSGAGAVMRA
jgi:hypothetical protein